MDYRKKLGKWGEDQAVKLLQKKTYKILERNFYTRYGEIDIIARQNDCLVFVEVKARKSGGAAEAVDWKKQEKMLNAAQIYLEKFGEDEFDIRFDCLALEKSKKGYVIKHFEDIIEAT